MAKKTLKELNLSEKLEQIKAVYKNLNGKPFQNKKFLVFS